MAFSLAIGLIETHNVITNRFTELGVFVPVQASVDPGDEKSPPFTPSSGRDMIAADISAIMDPVTHRQMN